MPLTLTRKVGQKLIISLAPDADPQEALRALQAEGIEIILREIYDHASKARLMIVAPRELLVLRNELVEHGDANNQQQSGYSQLEGSTDGEKFE